MAPTQPDLQTFAGAGRPTAAAARAKTSRFLILMAEGMTAENAARAAGLSPWRALRIVTESDFRDIVEAVRNGCGPVAVTLAKDEQDATLETAA